MFFFPFNFNLSLLPKEHHQKYRKFLQLNDINVFKKLYYSIAIHFLSVLAFHKSMPM